jgi:hypothetical protein
VCSRTAGVMTTLMRNGRDRRSGKPVKGQAILERALLVGTRSADHIRASGHNGCIATGQASTRKQAGYMAAPERFAKRQIHLAPRAPSIHGPYVASQGRDVPFRNRKGKRGHRPRPDRSWHHRTGLVRPPNPAAGGLPRPVNCDGGAGAADAGAPPCSAGRGCRHLWRNRSAPGRAAPPRSAVRCEVHACEASISTCRCELRIETMKPASTSTSAIMVSRKKVEVPACRTSRNSISMTMNSPIART